MSLRRRLAAVIGSRAPSPYEALERLERRLDDMQAQLTHVEQLVGAGATHIGSLAVETRDLAVGTHDLVNGELRAILRALVAEESANRRRLYSLRESPDYAAAWTTRGPLVTVTVATRERPKLLTERSLPSILGQTYGNLEVIVVGDDAGKATEEAMRALDDPRVTYRNLTQRLHFTDDPSRHWLVAATMARNEAMRLATGSWMVCFDDDDAMRPNCIERLLEYAREERLEAVYGRTLSHRKDSPDAVIGAFPPRHAQFSWASGMHHAGLSFFARELFAADMGEPGDWYQAERMLRAGVRFGMIDEILSDIYPSALTDPEFAG